MTPGEDRQRAGHRDAGGVAQQDADEQHRRRGRHGEGPQRAIGGDADRDRADHEGKEEEQDRSIAMPDLRLEAPQVADQQGRRPGSAIRALPMTVPTWTRGRVRPSSSSFSMSPTVIGSPSPTIASPARTSTWTGGTLARAWLRASSRELVVDDDVRLDERSREVTGEVALVGGEVVGDEVAHRSRARRAARPRGPSRRASTRPRCAPRPPRPPSAAPTSRRPGLGAGARSPAHRWRGERRRPRRRAPLRRAAPGSASRAARAHRTRELVCLVVGRRLEELGHRLYAGRRGLARGFRLARRVEGGVAGRANVALGDLARLRGSPGPG